MKYWHNRQKYIRVPRLINLRVARAYRTNSSEALCILTGMTPIVLKLEVVEYTLKVKQHQQAINLDHDVVHKYWPHLAKVITNQEVENYEEATISAYTDGSKFQKGVGSGVVLFKGSDIITRQKLKLEDRCSNNQAELLAIHKALEEIGILNRENINPLTATVYTDSRSLP